MSLSNEIKTLVQKAITDLYTIDVDETNIAINQTKAEFEGDYTVVLFALLKTLKKTPDTLGNELGKFLIENHVEIFQSYNIIKGFLNLVINDKYWIDFITKNYNVADFGKQHINHKKIMVEYSSPNTNKPLHLGHLRNIFLGWSAAEILKLTGNNVIKSCIVNDRGIHICKSMIAWKMFADGATPETTNTKGDHFVGDYYVRFNDVYKSQTQKILIEIANNNYSVFSDSEKFQVDNLLESINHLEKRMKNSFQEIDFFEIESLGTRIQITIELATDGNIKWKNVSKIYDTDEFAYLNPKEREGKQKWLHNKLKPIIIIEEKLDDENEKLNDLAGSKTSIMKAAQQMLVDWEAGKPDVIELWNTMNSWVYKGFDETYKRIGTDFDKIYYESQTYILGKNLIEVGLEKNVFYKEDDGSVWIDLTHDGLDKKIVRRKDGTAVYITQDIGLAVNKYDEYKINENIYVVGDEQNYHFKVLKLICEKLGLPSSKGMYHLNYGMVELPSGKMKSREGTVVDADDIVDEMINIAKQKTEELGKVKDFAEDELQELYETIGLGALKFFLLRVDPKRRMVFNPEESIDFHGFTGPFVQYTYARIKSVLRKIMADSSLLIEEKLKSHESASMNDEPLLPLEKNIITQLELFPSVIEEAATLFDPSKIALYVFNLSKTFNSFYTEHSIANAESKEKKQLRLMLALYTSNVIKTGMHLMGIKVPERM